MSSARTTSGRSLSSPCVRGNPSSAQYGMPLGDDIFLRLHPDWKEGQADAVRSACTNEERDVFVAVRDGRPVGFVAVALNAFHEGWP